MNPAGEQLWHTTADVRSLLALAAPRIGARKLGWVFVACAEAVLREHPIDDRVTTLLPEIGVFLDGTRSRETRHAVTAWASDHVQRYSGRAAVGNEAVRLNPRNVDRIRGFGPPAVAAKLLVDAVDHPLNRKWWEYPPEYDPREGPRFPTVERLRTEVLTEHSSYLRDIAGNPFRPVAFDPSWRTEAVVGLASGMYESRDFGPMPVLADALEDTGCADADIVSHCRKPGRHVRGCWVVDVILGKA